MLFSDKLKNKKFLVLFLVILIAAFIARVVFFGLVTTGHSQDGYWFARVGGNFINTGRFEYSPGYPYESSQPVQLVLIGIFSLIFRDLWFTGKVVSLFGGLLIIIFTYIFWKKIEDKKTAILASFFVAFGILNLWYSVAVREDSIYTALLILTLFFIYKIKDNNKYMPIAAIFIVLSALTRWEGYLLIPTAFFVFFIWNWKKFFKKKGINIKPFKNKYFVLSIIIILIPLLWWSHRSYQITGSWIPNYAEQLTLSVEKASAGLAYVTHIPDFIPWYFLVFITLGFFVSLKQYKKYFPVYLYLIFSLFVHMRFRGQSQMVLYITPILYGFLGLLIWKTKQVYFKKNKKVFAVLLILFLITFASISVIKSHHLTKEWGTRNDVIKEFGDWIEENSNPEDKILAPDIIVYSFFTDNEVIGFHQSRTWMQKYITEKQIDNKMIAYAAYLRNNNIKYFVAYDSTMEWFYTSIRDFVEEDRQGVYVFKEKTVTISPLEKFEANGEIIVLYEVS